MATRPSSITDERHLGIGASDAKRIIDGDWHTLWAEKMGEKEPEDLSRVFRVQLGIFTEDFHLDWLEVERGWSIGNRNDLIVHPDHAFMRAHVDGMIAPSTIAIEVKHSHGRNTARDGAIYYMPQLQHIMAVLGTDKMMFSLIAGNADPEAVEVERNQDYIDELIELEQSFWWHVENAIAPDIAPTGKAKALEVIGAKTVIDKRKPYDMTGHNEWASLAADYTGNAEAAATFDTAKKAIKELVPEDASEATGHGITIKRDKRGSLRFY